MTSPAPPTDAAEAILRLTAERGPEKSICPTEAARAIAGEDWRRRLPDIRRAAIALAVAGRIHILRKGRPMNPADFRGVYRLRIVPPDHS